MSADSAAPFRLYRDLPNRWEPELSWLSADPIRNAFMRGAEAMREAAIEAVDAAIAARPDRRNRALMRVSDAIATLHIPSEAK